jgi:predicted nuclease of predicted toxin-antitoxin system
LAGEKRCFYLDENIPVEVPRQLRSRHIDVLTVRDLGLLGDDHRNHLQRSTEMKSVLCTYDTDYLALAVKAELHAGIVIPKVKITRLYRFQIRIATSAQRISVDKKLVGKRACSDVDDTAAMKNV